MSSTKFVKIFTKPSEPEPSPARKKYRLGARYTAPASEIAYPYEGTFKVKTRQSHGMPTVDAAKEKTSCGCFSLFAKKKHHRDSWSAASSASSEQLWTAKLPSSAQYSSAYKPLKS